MIAAQPGERVEQLPDRAAPLAYGTGGKTGQSIRHRRKGVGRHAVRQAQLPRPVLARARYSKLEDLSRNADAQRVDQARREAVEVFEHDVVAAERIVSLPDGRVWVEV